MATSATLRLTAKELADKYGLNAYGPHVRDETPNSVGISKSKCFAYIELTLPDATELTPELVRKVVGAWEDLNLAKNEHFRAQTKYGQDLTFFEIDLEAKETNAVRLQRAINRLNERQERANRILSEGPYIITEYYNS